MRSNGSDVLSDYEEMVKNSENRSLFDLVNLLQRVKKETEKLNEEELKFRANMATKADGTNYRFLENSLMRRLKLESAEKNLRRMISEIENERK